MAISFVFWANISTGLWDPLGCSDLSQIFFGSLPTGIEWDKIVAEIIITTFVFSGHPTLCHFGAPWRPFWILQAVRRSRRLASAPFAARLVL